MPARAPAPFQDLPRLLLRPVPMFVFQPILARIARAIAAKHPGLFARLGPHAKKTFVIVPSNLPFVLVLKPDPDRVQFHACRSETEVVADARIGGTFLNLLRLVDGRMDGDAIFFSRDLKVEGDTEAIVSLRNALDDIEGSIAGDVAALFGPPGELGLSLLRRIEV